MVIALIITVVFAVVGGLFLSGIRNRPIIVCAPAFILYGAILLELTALIALRYQSGHWIFQYQPNPNRLLFDKHPYLVAVPKPGISVTIQGLSFQHNQTGFRSPEIDNPKTRFRIVAVGGSTTYGVGVSNSETWPAKLQEQLGDKYEVVNAGIPGHSTVEHLHFAAFQLPSLNPDLVILHVGLNDLHAANIPHIQPDYAPFHSSLVERSMGLCLYDSLPRVATIRAGALLLQKLRLYPECYKEEFPVKATELDSNALVQYEKNLRALIIQIQVASPRLLFVPQMLDRKRVAHGEYEWWAPGLNEGKLVEFLKTFNKATRKIADSFGVHYLDSADSREWTPVEFSDVSHLNAEGNTTLAQLIFTGLKSNQLVDLSN